MPLTAIQQALQTDLAAQTATVLIGGVATAIKDVPKTQDNAFVVRDWYNLTRSPAFWAWLSNSPLAETGKAVNMGDVGGLTTANSSRLQVSFQIRPNGFSPGLQDDRALFGSVFSAAGGAKTRAALIALWQRQVTNAEKLLCSGAGTQMTGDINADGSVTAGSPGTFGAFGGSSTPALVTNTDIAIAWGLM